MNQTKLRVPAELAYAGAVLILSFAVAMVASANFGVSMVVAPAYILSLRVDALTFGQSEYIVQALLFLVLCLLLRQVRLTFFFSFFTCLVYGAVLDLWRLVIPLFNPAVTPPGSMAFPLRCLLFGGGMILTAFSVALFYRTYLYPQVYDFFVKAVCERFPFDRTKFKICFDAGCLLVAVVLTLVFFGRFNGIGVGTLITALLNGFVIGLFSKLLNKIAVIRPLFPKLEQKFRLDRPDPPAATPKGE